MIAWLSDQLLAVLQANCRHPGEMVAVDLFEGCNNPAVAYCRRCGSVRIDWQGKRGEWRRPDPNMWRNSPQWINRIRARL